jgi:hypothetical protein
MQDNQFEGKISDELSTLSSLKHLDLSFNSLSGSFGDMIQELTNLCKDVCSCIEEPLFFIFSDHALFVVAAVINLFFTSGITGTIPMEIADFANLSKYR